MRFLSLDPRLWTELWTTSPMPWTTTPCAVALMVSPCESAPAAPTPLHPCRAPGHRTTLLLFHIPSRARPARKPVTHRIHTSYYTYQLTTPARITRPTNEAPRAPWDHLPHRAHRTRPRPDPRHSRRLVRRPQTVYTRRCCPSALSSGGHSEAQHEEYRRL